MKLPAFESLDEKMNNELEAYRKLNPRHYIDDSDFTTGFSTAITLRDIQWHKKVEKLIQTLQEISKYKPVGMNVYDVAEGAVDSAKSALAEFYGENDK